MLYRRHPQLHGGTHCVTLDRCRDGCWHSTVDSLGIICSKGTLQNQVQNIVRNCRDWRFSVSSCGLAADSSFQLFETRFSTKLDHSFMMDSAIRHAWLPCSDHRLPRDGVCSARNGRLFVLSKKDFVSFGAIFAVAIRQVKLNIRARGVQLLWCYVR